MKKSRKPLQYVQYVDVAGRMVPEDAISPRRRMLEIAAVLAFAAIAGYFVAPLLARALA